MSGFADPDIKIHLSLDQIIQMERGQINSELSWRSVKGFKKKKRHRRRIPDCDDHSVPLLPSAGGVGIYVSKKSSLLSAENRRRISEAFSNRAINSDLIEKAKEIIPAEYKLVRTGSGIERILVPVTEYFSKPVSTKPQLVPLRKLKKGSANDLSLPEKPPPLISSPIYSPPEVSLKMEVDDSDNEISILKDSELVKDCEVINVESESPVDVLENNASTGQEPSVMPVAAGFNSLSDRFTMLTGRLRF